MKATWNNTIIANSNQTLVIEGNHYFPPDSIKKEYFKTAIGVHTTCPWKGEASYYDIEIDGQINKGSAWYYSEPKESAKEIKNYIAFWRGVKVSK